MRPVTDSYGRSFKTLRVSLLSRCNLGCVYCTSGKPAEVPNAAGDAELTLPAFVEIIRRLHAVLHLEAIRFTGGEPLLFRHLATMIGAVKEMGIPEIRMTTNGFLLSRMAAELKDAGLDSINVSLDAIDEAIFFSMAKRNHVQRVLDGIETAIEAGMQVKLNAVIMKGINDKQILPLLHYASCKNIRIRFLEVMAMGHLHDEPEKYLFRQEEILDVIRAGHTIKRLERRFGSTSNYWQTGEGQVFGVIANESAPFCHDCNRLRLDSNGNIFGCLSSNQPVSLRGVHDLCVFQDKLQESLLQKQAVRFTGSSLSMLHIGG